MDKEYRKYLLDKTKQDYSLIAGDFSRTRTYPWQEIRFLFDKYLSLRDKVLDLGCGNGRYSPFFNKKGVYYFGVDSSKELIAIARKKYRNANFRVENALNLSFPDYFFDKVFTIAVLHQIPSSELRDKFLEQVNRVLKPGGLLIMTVWNFYRFQEFLLLLKYTLLKLVGKSKLDWKDIFVPWGDKTKRYYHWFSSVELNKITEQKGFMIIESGIVKNMKGNRQNIYLVAQKLLKG